MISLRQVSKHYSRGAAGPGLVTAVDRISFEVEAGEIVVLLGASGCGKTTTLKMINRLIECSEGEIRVAGKNVADQDPVTLRRSIGYVFQGVGLFPHHSVASNIAAVPRLLGWERPRIDARVDELLELVGLAASEYRDRQPSELSGGQQQRVGVARALAAESSILLMDEPFGAVDPVTRDSLQQQLLATRDALGLTILLVTHDVNEALLLADRVAVMERGALLQLGTPAELFASPASVEVARLLETPRRQADRLHAMAHASNDGVPADEPDRA
ncbi:MAG: ATP-binding cassette domain-containing protein [bacterium]|nr:ATP-binding cassette domain-containing protein [bacterium]